MGQGKCGLSRWWAVLGDLQSLIWEPSASQLFSGTWQKPTLSTPVGLSPLILLFHPRLLTCQHLSPSGSGGVSKDMSTCGRVRPVSYHPQSPLLWPGVRLWNLCPRCFSG